MQATRPYTAAGIVDQAIQLQQNVGRAGAASLMNKNGTPFRVIVRVLDSAARRRRRPRPEPHQAH